MTGHTSFRQVDLRLQTSLTVWLSTTSPHGHKHCVPVWFWWEADAKSLYFISSRSAAKSKNLNYEPRVIIHTGEGDDTIILEGMAEAVKTDAERQRIGEQWQAKYAASCGKAEINHREMMLFRVKIFHAIVWQYEKDSINPRTNWNFEDTPVNLPVSV